jgi:hypothetical protein
MLWRMLTPELLGGRIESQRLRRGVDGMVHHQQVPLQVEVKYPPHTVEIKERNESHSQVTNFKPSHQSSPDLRFQ